MAYLAAGAADVEELNSEQRRLKDRTSKLGDAAAAAGDLKRAYRNIGTA
jgi:hypothetical protein